MLSAVYMAQTGSSAAASGTVPVSGMVAASGAVPVSGAAALSASGVETFLETVNQVVWGPWMICLFIGTGVFFSMSCGWMQIRCARMWLWESVGKYFSRKNRRQVSDFRSVCTILSATVGTGNLVGVSAALIAGGPGAIFWMWAAAILGMMTAYAENVLGILHRDEKTAGPMAYIQKLPYGRKLAVVYAFLCVCCGLGMGNLTQINTAAEAVSETFGIPALVTGILFALVIAVVAAGGKERFGRVIMVVTPGMAAMFLTACFFVLAGHREQILPALREIISEAFRPEAAAGGAAGYGIQTAMRMGIARGVFTNEAGIGTSVFANEGNDGASPKKQGFLAMFAVFADTIIMCTLTALVLLVSGIYDTAVYGAAAASGTLEKLPDATMLLVQSFETVFGKTGGIFLTVLTMVFAFSTLLAWSGFAGQAWNYCTRGRGNRFFYGIFLMVIVVGSVVCAQLVWQISDLFNGAIALINLTALLCCCRAVIDISQRNIDEL